MSLFHDRFLNRATIKAPKISRIRIRQRIKSTFETTRCEKKVRKHYKFEKTPKNRAKSKRKNRFRKIGLFASRFPTEKQPRDDDRPIPNRTALKSSSMKRSMYSNASFHCKTQPNLNVHSLNLFLSAHARRSFLEV